MGCCRGCGLWSALGVAAAALVCPGATRHTLCSLRVRLALLPGLHNGSSILTYLQEHARPRGLWASRLCAQPENS